MLKIKEIFYSIQGEGYNSGKPCIFVRFSGCNLWSGNDVHKPTSPCYFCDTDFVGGNTYSHRELIDVLSSLWVANKDPFIIFTGGEPTLQLTNLLLDDIYNTFLLRGLFCKFAIETNGELDSKYTHDVWVTMSPKTKKYLRKSCNELKILYPLSILPHEFLDISCDFKYIQPIYGENYKNNLDMSLQYCLENPDWSLSLQQHKILNIL